MGVADSPLQGRVLFVEGAPRSGTTWITALLGVHPQIVATGSESHLFDMGVNALFDNHEGPGWGTYLSAYLSRDELTDLARDLCDGVLLRLRERGKPDAALVAEKTPVFGTPARQVLARKLACYPDAWYLHILRDERAAARSMARSPFAEGRSERACLRGIRDATDAVREATLGHPRYLEVEHEALQADPAAGVADILRWLDLDAGEAVLDRVRGMSGEHFSRYQPTPSRAPLPPSVGRAVREGRRIARSLKGALEVGSGGGPSSQELAVAERMIAAVRDGKADALRELTAPAFAIEMRTGTGDLVAKGDEARRALLEFGERVLGRFFVTVEWAPADGVPYSTFLFHAIDGDAARVDVSLHAFPEGDRVGRLTIVSAGSLDGRPFATWSGDRETARP